MPMRTTTLLITILMACAAPDARTAVELSLASPFSDHMVLQRGEPLRVWGTAEPGAAVNVSVAGQRATATADAAGKWMAEVPALKAGGPHEIVVTAGEATLALREVLVGDVWLCSGQSNMQQPLKDTAGGKEAAAAASKAKDLRLLMVPKAPSTQPAERFDARWARATEDSASTFSAVGMYFALALRENGSAAKDVPIGLIDSSFGGTRVEGWIPQAVLDNQFNAADLHDSIFGIKPAQLYNGMVAPLVGLNVRGVLWYQGESNARHPETYPAMLGAMIAQWRGDFRSPRLPFYLVQLPNYPEVWEGMSFAWLREAQAKAARSVDHVAMAVTIDTPDGYDLHPRHKRHVGERLALLACRHTYGEDVVASGPVLKSAAVEGARMRLTFETLGSPLVAKDGELTGFALAGADGAYRNAAARVDGENAVIVESAHVREPKTVRYAWSADPRASLYNQAGLPAAPFRTDDAPPAPMREVQRTLPVRRVVTEKYRATIEGDGSLSSLLVAGQQMLNTDASGGFVTLSVWGPRKLFECAEIGPDVVRFSDGVSTVTYTFDAGRIRIDVSNNESKEALPVRLQLAPLVERSQGGETFTRDRGGVSIQGFDKCEKRFGYAYELKADVPSRQQRTLEIVVTKQP